MKSREADLPHRPPKPVFLQGSLHTGRSTVLHEQPRPPEAAAHQALRPQALPAQTPVSLSTRPSSSSSGCRPETGSCQFACVTVFAASELTRLPASWCVPNRGDQEVCIFTLHSHAGKRWCGGGLKTQQARFLTSSYQ